MTSPLGTPVRTDAGFTLLETLVVVAILALVIGVSLPLLRGPSPASRLDAAAAGIIAGLQLTRSFAIAHQADATFVLAPDGRSFSTPAIASNRPLNGVTAGILPASAAGPDTKGMAAVAFFPDGTSSGGLVVVGPPERRAVIEVSVVSGRARLRRP